MSLKVVTYNLQGVSSEDVEKIAELVKSADIVAFQEIGVNTVSVGRIFDAIVAAMKKHDFSFRRFDTAIASRDTIELLFAKVPIIETLYVPFRRSSTPLRGVSLYTISLKITPEVTKLITVGSAQLDSPTCSGTVNQRQQLSQLWDIARSPYVVLLVDTNLRSWQSFDSADSTSGYLDAWRECGSSSTELTYDSKRNAIASQYREDACDRRDRIYYKGGECVALTLLGANSRPLISSHYGVEATIKFT